jgi:nuclear GTP-binding protein
MDDSSEKMKERPTEPARIEPDPKWFGNVRTIDQRSLENLRIEMKEQIDDTYAVLLNKRKLPMSLIREDESKPTVNVLDFEKYEVRVSLKNRTPLGPRPRGTSLS